MDNIFKYHSNIIIAYIFVFLCNQLWISIGITSLIVIVLTLINYFKLAFRDDPLLVEDLSLFSEMKNMTGRYKIYINKAMIIWMLSMALIVFFTWKIRNVLQMEMMHRTRLFFVIITILSGIFCMQKFILNGEYYQKTENIALINRWAGTQQFISRGFIYPFLYSGQDIDMKKPNDYSKKKIENSLQNIKDDNIAEDKKVNILSIMLEAYGDFSVYPQLEFNSENDPYAALDRIKEISYHGNLLTDIFAAGTVKTE